MSEHDEVVEQYNMVQGMVRWIFDQARRLRLIRRRIWTIFVSLHCRVQSVEAQSVSPLPSILCIIEHRLRYVVLYIIYRRAVRKGYDRSPHLKHSLKKKRKKEYSVYVYSTQHIVHTLYFVPCALFNDYGVEGEGTHPLPVYTLQPILYVVCCRG